MDADCNVCPDCVALRAQLAAKETELFELTESLTRHDRLTGALNRRSLTELLSEELQRSSRTGQPFCFAVIGVDQFDQVRQQYGHDTGDTVFQLVAHEAETLMRTLDRCGRVESDEFGIILPATALPQGLRAMDRFGARIAEFDWGRFTAGHKVTISAGLTANAPGEAADAMIQRAQKALAEARAAGLGRVVAVEDQLLSGPAGPAILPLM